MGLNFRPGFQTLIVIWSRQHRKLDWTVTLSGKRRGVSSGAVLTSDFFFAEGPDDESFSPTAHKNKNFTLLAEMALPFVKARHKSDLLYWLCVVGYPCCWMALYNHSTPKLLYLCRLALFLQPSRGVASICVKIQNILQLFHGLSILNLKPSR